MAHLLDVASGRVDPTDAADAADPLHPLGHWTHDYRCVDPDARSGSLPCSLPCEPRVLPEFLPVASVCLAPTDLSPLAVPSTSFVSAASCLRRERFQLVSLLLASLACGLLTILLLALSVPFHI